MGNFRSLDFPHESFSEDEVEHMARSLVSIHGTLAAQQADFFAQVHELLGDSQRMEAWRRVLVWLVAEGYAPKSARQAEAMALNWTQH